MRLESYKFKVPDVTGNETRLSTKQWVCEENCDNQGQEAGAGHPYQ